MSDCRVQKLLFSEFCDFDDMVLLESPFAQTTKDGTGIRQVHLGLTPSKLVLATDVLPPVDENLTSFIPGVDPEIETFELIAIYPVTCVNLSIYRRKSRQALKARFCNNKVLYFELGGFQRRKMFWNLWCEKVKFLSPEGSNSSKSETSVATSTTGSTLYLLDKKLVTMNGLKQLWCKFGPSEHGIDNNLLGVVFGNNAQKSSALMNRWTDKHLYLGNKFSDYPLEYRPIMNPPQQDFLPMTKSERDSMYRNKFTLHLTNSSENRHLAQDVEIGDSVQVNRFGKGTAEGCSCGLYLTADSYVVPHRYSQTCELGHLNMEEASSETQRICNELTCDHLLDYSIHLWEQNQRNIPKHRIRHKRRYGFSPQPFFLHGLGPWTVNSGSNYTLQLKRVASEVHIAQTSDNGIRLPISKRHLIASISCTQLNQTGLMKINWNRINSPTKPVILFWTPDYWYRPRSIRETYLDLRRHFKKITNYIEDVCKRNAKSSKRKKRLFRKLYSREVNKDSEEECAHEGKKSRYRKQKQTYLKDNRDSNFAMCCWPRSITDPEKLQCESSIQYLKRMLRLEVTICAWDFDSTTLAEQLTMIDRDLFLKVSPEELAIILWKQSTKCAPNVLAVLAFSHRISCLIAYEILKDNLEKMRARLIARFINVADKCHMMSNFQSCKTVLCGLQSPSIYRLKNTWAYVRKKHATKYHLFQYLCKLYRDPRLPSYQKIFFILSQNSPFLPHIGDIMAKLLNKIPEYDVTMYRRRSRSCSNTTLDTIGKSSRSKSVDSFHCAYSAGNIITKLLNTIRMLSSSNAIQYNPKQKGTDRKPRSHRTQLKRKYVAFKCLDEYYKPLWVIEDNRVRCLEEVTEFLERCQIGAINYCFVCNELAKSYLLKARYKEDKDNFINSLSVEPANYISTNKK